jgi:Ser-tRNA(Ala) deacylase AlaX
VASAEPVQIGFWGKADCEREGLERLIPEGWDWEIGGELRVVRIGEVDVYPCGGTHVERTDLCGKVGVRKISRQKGGSRVGYTVD